MRDGDDADDDDGCRMLTTMDDDDDWYQMLQCTDTSMGPASLRRRGPLLLRCLRLLARILFLCVGASRCSFRNVRLASADVMLMMYDDV